MRTYYDTKSLIAEFLKENNLLACDLMRVAKDLCCCRTCRFFVQHYSKDGIPLDFGHCRKNNLPKSKRPDTQSCGFWELEKDTKGSGDES